MSNYGFWIFGRACMGRRMLFLFNFQEISRESKRYHVGFSHLKMKKSFPIHWIIDTWGRWTIFFSPFYSPTSFKSVKVCFIFKFSIFLRARSVVSFVKTLHLVWPQSMFWFIIIHKKMIWRFGMGIRWWLGLEPYCIISIVKTIY